MEKNYTYTCDKCSMAYDTQIEVTVYELVYVCSHCSVDSEEAAPTEYIDQSDSFESEAFVELGGIS